MSRIIQCCVSFFKKEITLSVAVLLAGISMFFVPPNLSYVSYIDWNTLALLFSLMAVMKGFQKIGLFVFLGNQLLKQTKTLRKMLFILVFLPFVSSMVITNDVALITFVPFGFIVLRMAKQERLVIPLVVMQTLAANLGSMLTPMGNPQNLYLYGKSGIGFIQFCFLMLPYVLLSGVGLTVLILLQKSFPVCKVSTCAKIESKKGLLCGIIGLFLCFLGLFEVVSPLVIAVVIAAFLLFADRKLLAQIDYALLATFFALFVLIGNIGHIESFQTFISSALTDHVEWVSILTSQLISNVPAALLLSGLTSEWENLIVGCNLGGLGTLIASMASLISYKMVAKEYPNQCKKYLLIFTLYNLCFLGVLFLVSVFI